MFICTVQCFYLLLFSRFSTKAKTNQKRDGWDVYLDLILSCREVRELNPYHTYFKIYKYQIDFWKQMKTTIFCFLSFFLFFGSLNLTLCHKGIFPLFTVWFFWNNWLKATGDLIQNESSTPFAHHCLWSVFFLPYPFTFCSHVYFHHRAVVAPPPPFFLIVKFTLCSLFWRFILVDVLEIRIIRIKREEVLLFHSIIYYFFKPPCYVVISRQVVHLLSKEKRKATSPPCFSNSSFMWEFDIMWY